MAKGWPQDFLEAKDVEVSQPGRKNPKEMVLDTHVKIRDFRTNLFFILGWGWALARGFPSKFFLALYVSLPHQVVVVPPKVAKWARLGRDVPDNKIVFILINCFCFPKTEETSSFKLSWGEGGLWPRDFPVKFCSLQVVHAIQCWWMLKAKVLPPKVVEMGKIGKGRNYPKTTK